MMLVGYIGENGPQKGTPITWIFLLASKWAVVSLKGTVCPLPTARMSWNWVSNLWWGEGERQNTASEGHSVCVVGYVPPLVYPTFFTLPEHAVVFSIIWIFHLLNSVYLFKHTRTMPKSLHSFRSVTTPTADVGWFPSVVLFGRRYFGRIPSVSSQVRKCSTIHKHMDNKGSWVASLKLKTIEYKKYKFQKLLTTKFRSLPWLQFLALLQIWNCPKLNSRVWLFLYYRLDELSGRIQILLPSRTGLET